jgi:hypothetical protein
MHEPLDETNFLLYAAKHYMNDECYDTVEFYDDLKRIKYIKRLFNRYKEAGDYSLIKERLILNHLIVLYNVFGSIPTTRMLFMKMGETYASELKTFVEFLSFMPDSVDDLGIERRNYVSKDILTDKYIRQKLMDL